MKYALSLYIDSEVVDQLKRQHYNLSKLVNDYFHVIADLPITAETETEEQQLSPAARKHVLKSIDANILQHIERDYNGIVDIAASVESAFECLSVWYKKHTELFGDVDEFKAYLQDRIIFLQHKSRWSASGRFKGLRAEKSKSELQKEAEELWNRKEEPMGRETAVKIGSDGEKNTS